MNREKTLLATILVATLIVAFLGFSVGAQFPEEIWKKGYPDYAPVGIPDFDQRQKEGWTNPNPPLGTLSWCGPTAVANSLWWMDSRFEDPDSPPPPTISDSFVMVTRYDLTWDDHDPQNAPPFIEDLAWYMDTDGQRTASTQCGTYWWDMYSGILDYLQAKRLDKYFYVDYVEPPLFEDIVKEIERFEDVILLLGFWQEQEPGVWVRVGGHYVTVEAVETLVGSIAISDPIRDLAEQTGQGFVPNPHPLHADPTVHNNASLVSYDTFGINFASPSPGGIIGLYDYYPEEVIYNIAANGHVTGEYIEILKIEVEVEVMIKVSPICVTEDGYKPPFNDYAQSGMPDFDQKQDEWYIPEQWTWCGPTAVANSLWWMDSRFEDPDSPPPPTISDSFVMVTRYDLTWDDHDPQNAPPFIEDLAWYMDTDGQRTASTQCGTYWWDMYSGILDYLQAKRLDKYFYVDYVEPPLFEDIVKEIERFEDVILLLGFWQEQEPGVWVRVGGHYVTVSGVWSDLGAIAFSDPYINNAEAGGLGRVLPFPHIDISTTHNNATFVSHDVYAVQPSISPGGVWGISDVDYPIYTNIWNFLGQNPGPPLPMGELYELPIYIEVEYMVTVSPIPGKAVLTGDANGDGYVNVEDLGLMSDAWLAEIGDENFDPTVDLNFDGYVNVEDLGIMSDWWLEEAPEDP